jgi:tRNA(Ile)-lysidine synthase
VFDGRFEIACAMEGYCVGFLQGLAARLPDAQRRRLSLIPAAARGALPAAISPAGAVSCLILDEAGAIAAQPLAGLRLSATLGAIADEAALWRVAKLTAGP